MVKRERLRLRVLRAMHGWTQMQAAREAGMGRFRYWQIENHEGPDLTSDERDAVAAAFGRKSAEIEWDGEVVKVRAS